MPQDEHCGHADRDQNDHQTPRDAASLIILKDLSTDAPSVLMGRRHPDNVFLPNKYVFPGGRFDDADSRAQASEPLSDDNRALLSLSLSTNTSTDQVGALALTAIRETFEETGVVIGAPGAPDDPPPSASWQSFVATGHLPNPGRLTFFARAVTPPGRPRRYDTRFFCVDADDIAGWHQPVDNELSDIGWVSLLETGDKDVASITKLLFSDLQSLATERRSKASPGPIPFYFYDQTGFQRVLLSHQDRSA